MWEESEARSLAEANDLMPKTLKEHQDKCYNVALDMAYGLKQHLKEELEKMRDNGGPFTEHWRLCLQQGRNTTIDDILKLIE